MPALGMCRRRSNLIIYLAQASVDLEASLQKSVSGPFGRARQVLDLRRSLQKLDLAERELATAFVGTVVSSALPPSAAGNAAPSSSRLVSPHLQGSRDSGGGSTRDWAGRLGGVDASGEDTEIESTLWHYFDKPKRRQVRSQKHAYQRH